jgi:hypothetical protein
VTSVPPDDLLERAIRLAREKVAAVAAAPQTQSAPPEAAACPDAMQAAAVVSRYRIDDLEKIAGDDDVERVISDSIPVADRTARGYWTLLPDVRGAVLSEILARNRLAVVLSDGKSLARGDDALYGALVGLDSEGPRALQSMSVAALAAIAPYTAQFEVAHRGFPARQDLERRLEMLRFLEPFDRLIEEGFFNRTDELRGLRVYVDVLESEGIFESIQRGLASTRQLPLLITGVGGVGKSTLVAKFVTDHARAAEGEPFPFAYLDFDRRAVMVDEPASILVEAVRQIAVQYPQAHDAAEQLRHSWRRLLQASARRGGSAAVEAREYIRRDFVGFTQKLEVDSGRPVLLVLDTFEEVQYRNRVYVEVVGNFLAQLRADIPRLRVVIVGRAPVPEIKFAETIVLDEFDRKSALAFLARLGIANGELADAIVKQVGANPLTLRLAAAVFRSEPDDPSLRNLAAVSKANIQGYLFERILRHVHNDDVRNIAHPGLVLRRVTAGIIRHVLAGPCGIDVPTDARAQELFEELQREVSLVSPGTEPGVVVHRSDVRRLMLRGLRETEPVKVPAIHRGAADYYRQFDDAESRAEEVYHLLWLEEHDQARSRFREDAAQFLFNAVDELPGPEKALLSDLIGREIPADARAAATSEIWERSAQRRVSEYIRQGDFKAALKVLGEQPDRSPATLLPVLEASVYAATNELDRAAELIAKAVRAYDEASNWRDAIEAHLVAHDIAVRRGDVLSAISALEQAEALARGDDVLLARVLVVKLRVTPADDEVRRELLQVAARIPEASWMQQGPLLRRIAAIAGKDDVGLVANAVRIAGGYVLPSDTERMLDEVLGLAPMLSNLLAALSVEDTWARIQAAFASGTDEAFRAQLADAVAAAFAVDDVVARAPRPPGPKVKVDIPAVADLLAMSELQPHRLGDLLVRQFDRNLPSITFARDRRTVFEEVLRFAEGEGWLASLLDAIRPLLRDGAAVLDYLDGLGIGVSVEYVGGPALRVPELAQARLAHRGAIALIEQRVCRIEVKGKFRGTGFLVAPDVILTASPTVTATDSEIVVRFDYGAIGGKRYNAGVSCSARPLPVRGESAILLRLVRSVGREPVGGEVASRHAPVRRVFDLAAAAVHAAPPKTLYWFWQTEKDGLFMTGSNELAVAEGSIAVYANDRSRFIGSPCFNENFRLVGLHCGPHPERRREGLVLPAWNVLELVRGPDGATLVGRGEIRLAAQELSELRETLLSAFTIDELRMLLSDEFNLRLDDIARPQSAAAIVLDVLRHFQQRNQIAKLLEVAAGARPENVRLDALCRRHLGQ